MIREKYDVVVVGGGPGGSSAAKTLADNGLDVALLEKRPAIGSPKQCAEGVSLSTIKTVEKLMGEMPDKCIAQMIDGAIVYAPNGKEINIDLKKDAGAVLERREYDKWLARMASGVGAHIQANTEVTGVIKENGYIKGVRAEFGGESFEVRSKVVVAADGVASTVARKAGLNTTHELANIDSGFQYEMSNLKLRDPHKIELRFGNKIAPRGYLWIFPKGQDVANVGVGVAGTNKSAEYFLNRFIQENQSVFSNASIIEVNAGGIPVGGLLESMVLNGFLVLGDAAHQVNSIHGGGIKEAMLAAIIAGKVIARAISENDYSQESLSEYDRVWWEERGQTLKKIEKFKDFVGRLNDENLNKIARVTTGDDLIAFTRGKRYSVLGKLFLRDPSLIFLLGKLRK